MKRNRNNRKIFLLICRNPTNFDQYLNYNSQLQKSYKESVFPPCRTYSILTNRDDLTKENNRIKQVLNKTGYQKKIMSNICTRNTNNNTLSQSQQQMQATDIQEVEIKWV